MIADVLMNDLGKDIEAIFITFVNNMKVGGNQDLKIPCLSKEFN